MTPKEKAKDLIEKFKAQTQQFNESKGWYEDLEAAKECAFIVVYEVIKVLEEFKDNNSYKNKFGIIYFQQVKEEINKL